MSKATRKRFGVRGTALSISRLYGKGMDFNHPTMKTGSYIAITPDGKSFTHFNLYDGDLGRNFESQFHPVKADWDFSAPKGELKKKLKGYSEVPQAQWPAVVTSEPQSAIESEIEGDEDAE